VQPYKRAKPAHHVLAILHRLDISDKHRELLITVVGVQSLGWFGEIEPTAFNPGPYDDGAEVCRFPYPSTDAQNQFNPVMGFSVRLNEPAAGPWSLTLGAADVLRQSLRYVENEVLPRFRSYF
jgi:hypothetical protein